MHLPTIPLPKTFGEAGRNQRRVSDGAEMPETPVGLFRPTAVRYAQPEPDNSNRLNRFMIGNRRN